jgi:hypothetical protein
MTPKVEAIRNDPAASCWLQDALGAALSRDPVDAAADAEALAEALRERAEAILRVGE